MILFVALISKDTGTTKVLQLLYIAIWTKHTPTITPQHKMQICCK